MLHDSRISRILPGISFNAASVLIFEDNGTQTAGPTGWLKGTTRTTGVTNVNFKNVDDTATAYSASPITAGNNSYPKYQGLVFTGTYNLVGNVLVQHVSGVLDSALTLKGNVSGSGFYATPSTSAPSLFTRFFTSTGLISTGLSMLVGGIGPEASGKAATTAVLPAWTEYLGLQLQTTASALPGDTATCTFQYQYDEN
jgi:hypothetical protein